MQVVQPVLPLSILAQPLWPATILNI